MAHHPRSDNAAAPRRCAACRSDHEHRREPDAEGHRSERAEGAPDVSQRHRDTHERCGPHDTGQPCADEKLEGAGGRECGCPRRSGVVDRGRPESGGAGEYRRPPVRLPSDDPSDSGRDDRHEHRTGEDRVTADHHRGGHDCGDDRCDGDVHSQLEAGDARDRHQRQER